MAKGTTLVGPVSWVAERLAAFATAGVTTLNVIPVARAHADRLRLVEQIRQLADSLPGTAVAPDSTAQSS